MTNPLTAPFPEADRELVATYLGRIVAARAFTGSPVRYPGSFRQGVQGRLLDDLRAGRWTGALAEMRGSIAEWDRAALLREKGAPRRQPTVRQAPSAAPTEAVVTAPTSRTTETQPLCPSCGHWTEDGECPFCPKPEPVRSSDAGPRVAHGFVPEDNF